LALFSGTLFGAKLLAFPIAQEELPTKFICTPVCATCFKSAQILQAQEVVENRSNAEQQSVQRGRLATIITEVCNFNLNALDSAQIT
jgi:hypothetical protein